MLGSFSLYFPSPSTDTFTLVARNTGGQDLSFQISGSSPSITLGPASWVRFLIKPSGYGLTDDEMSGLLNRQYQNNPSVGTYYTQVHNLTTIEKSFSNPIITIPSYWENTPFDLAWLSYTPLLPTGFGKTTTSVYSFPHNLQRSEVILSGAMSSTEEVINYRMYFTPLSGEGNAGYTGGTSLPYSLYVKYAHPNIHYPYNPSASGFETGTKYFGSGSALTGVAFELPFYDKRIINTPIPAQYIVQVNYNSLGSVKPGSIPLSIDVDHSFVKDSFLVDMTALARAQPDTNLLHEIGPVRIPADTISRRRLAIGIQDITSVEKIFSKRGTFLSNSYNLNFNIYTFYLKVQERIPDYTNLNKYDTVKYYISFNNGVWERISPNTRPIEYDENDNIIPKMFLFDTTSQAYSSALIKNILIAGLVNNFRVKIVFDLSSLSEAIFTPPEVYNYKCVIFDKEHFVDLEV